MTIDTPESTQILTLHIEKRQEGTYFTLPFTLPAQVEALSLSYSYDRLAEVEAEAGKVTFMSRKVANRIDLGLIAPDGTQVGASGSGRHEIFISATQATPGYRPHALVPGEWRILVGAYCVAAGGVTVTYTLKLTPKHLRLLKGDLHSHTFVSDGVQSAAELAFRAKRNGLDFLAITDHNQPPHPDELPNEAGITLLPSMEYTLYRIHANFLGITEPYEGSFYANTAEEIQTHFDSAHARGATIVLNHPFDEECPLLVDASGLPVDLIEVWNGPMRESNLKAVAYWHNLLLAGKKIPMCGGSDFHRDTPFLFLGGPTTGVYTMSDSAEDILDALKHGHSFVTFAPNGPTAAMTAGEALLGDSVAWAQTRELKISAAGLQAEDILRVVTNQETVQLFQAPENGSCELSYPMPGPGFARLEILRAFLPGLPLLPALLTNPIYFD